MHWYWWLAIAGGGGWFVLALILTWYGPLILTWYGLYRLEDGRPIWNGNDFYYTMAWLWPFIGPLVCIVRPWIWLFDDLPKKMAARNRARDKKITADTTPDLGPHRTPRCGQCGKPYEES